MRPKRLHILLILILLPVLIASCAAKSAEMSSSDRGMATEQALGMPAPAAQAPMAEKVVSESEGARVDSYAGDAASLTDRMIIQTVNMGIVVEDTDQVLVKLQGLVARYEGFVSSSNRWLSDEQAYANVTIRVPAGDLNAVIAEIEGMAILLESKNTSGQDVTEEFYDLQARLRNLQATETELLALLTEVRENRGKADEILAIYRELTDIRGQIEALQGRKQYLERMTALATINIDIKPKEAPRAISEPAKWNPLVTASKGLRGFVSVLRGLIDLLIYLLIFSPFVIVPVLVVWLLIRWIKRLRARKKQ